MRAVAVLIRGPNRVAAAGIRETVTLRGIALAHVSLGQAVIAEEHEVGMERIEVRARDLGGDSIYGGDVPRLPFSHRYNGRVELR